MRNLHHNIKVKKGVVPSQHWWHTTPNYVIITTVSKNLNTIVVGSLKNCCSQPSRVMFALQKKTDDTVALVNVSGDTTTWGAVKHARLLLLHVNSTTVSCRYLCSIRRTSWWSRLKLEQLYTHPLSNNVEIMHSVAWNCFTGNMMFVYATLRREDYGQWER